MANKKILTVLGVLLAMGLTACGGKTNPSGGSGGGGGASTSKHTHSWGDWSETKAATCTEQGEKQRTCSGCNEVDIQKTNALGHDYKDGEEYIQEGVKYLECSRCFKGVLEWDAKNYDKDNTVVDTSTTNGVKFTSQPTIANDTNDGIVERSYVTYKIQAAKAVAHAGLDFELTPSSHNVAIFETIDNDEKPGKDINEAGEIITSTHRYALYVNNQRVQLGKGPDASAEKAWYTWPVDFALNAGENTIRLVCMGGYRGVMHNFRLTNIPHYEHQGDYQVKVGQEAAGTDYIATETYACTQNCGKTAIRWSALDYDQTKTAARSGEGKGPESRDSGKAIRFSDEVQYKAVQEGDVWNPVETVKGCHIVYNVKTPELKNVGLALYSTARNDVGTVFDKFEGDTAKGYERIDGELKRPDSRYGLKIDGQVYLLEADGQGWKGTAWYDMPIRIPELSAGVHEFEIYNFGGYRVDMYNFQLTSCPAVQGSTFELDNAEWKSDDNGHWKELEAYAGVKFVYAEHKFVADTAKTDVPADCDTAGKHYVKCSVCGKEAEQAIPALGHKWVYGEVTVTGSKGTQEIECSVCHEKSTVTGGVYASFTFNDATQADGATLDSGKFRASSTYKLRVFNVPEAGVYTITLPMKGSSGNGGKVMNPADGQNKGQGFSLAANDAAGVFYGNGKTYEQFLGTDQTVWVDVLFGEVTLAKGANVITITTDSGGYRLSLNATSNITLAPKAAA